ncbi:MAG TPA: GNAT family N-acetyltransferase [Gemmatimonadaceae bacterium]|nr:GNAT family N-acetyltransferase [Gemmatimonadaceae bacterium]
MQQLLEPRDAPRPAMHARFPTIESAREAGPFQSSAWLRHWVEHRGVGLEPFPVVVDDGATVAPFGRLRMAGLRVLRLLGSGDSDFNGLISTRSPADAWDSVLAELARRRREWDLLHLHSVAEREAILPALERHFRRPGMARLYEACPFIRITGTWAEFIGARKTMRREVGRWTRRLEELGPLTVQSVKAPVPQETLDAIVEIERDSWKWEYGNAAFKAGSQRDFLFAVLRDADAPARVWTLRVGDRTAAFAIVLEGVTRWYFYNTTYRQEFKNAGSMLLARLVEAAHDAGCTSFSLLRGDLHYKNDWANDSEDVYEIVCASSRLGQLGAFAYQARWRAATSPLIRRIRSVLLRAGDRR